MLAFEGNVPGLSGGAEVLRQSLGPCVVPHWNAGELYHGNGECWYIRLTVSMPPPHRFCYAFLWGHLLSVTLKITPGCKDSLMD